MKQEKIDKLLDAVGNLPDEMIAEADPTNWKKQEKQSERVVFFRGYRKIAVVAVLVLAVGGLWFGMQKLWQMHATDQRSGQSQNIEMADTVQDQETQKTSFFDITVMAYAKEKEEHAQKSTTGKDAEKKKVQKDQTSAAENRGKSSDEIKQNDLAGYEKLELKEGKIINLSAYSPTMSSVPAMPFSFDCKTNEKKISIYVESDRTGVLQKWDINDEGEWNVREEKQKLKCDLEEIIYWKPTKLNEKNSILTVKIYEGKQCAAVRKIRIHCNDQLVYQAELLAEEKE